MSGILLASYTTPRLDVADLVPHSARRILELGCSNGSTARVLSERQDCVCVGVERDEELATQARMVMRQVFVRNLDERDWFRGIESGFDCIIAADVLEHLIDPWRALREAVGHLAPGGCVVLSIPNARHIQTILNLVRGRWPYRDRGVHDATHLRFFTLREIRALCGIAGLRIERLVRNRRFLDRTGPWDRAARIGRFLGLGEFLTYQYVLRARSSADPELVNTESAPGWHLPVRLN